MKKIGIIVIVLSTMLILSGCSTTNEPQDEKKHDTVVDIEAMPEDVKITDEITTVDTDAQSVKAKKTISLQQSNESYTWKDGEVYFNMESGLMMGRGIVEGIDKNTFQVINKYHAKDKNNVYYGNSIIEEADPDTFNVIIDNYYNYTKDKNHIYLDGKTIIDTDPNTFELINDRGISKDKNSVYFYADKIEEANPDQTQLIETNVSSSGGSHFGFLLTQNEVYSINGQPLPRPMLQSLDGADPSSFHQVSDYIYSDDNAVYVIVNYQGLNIDMSHKITSEGRNSPDCYGYGNEIIIFKNADEASLEFIDECHAKDKNYVYYNGEIIVGESPDTFIIPETDQ